MEKSPEAFRTISEVAEAMDAAAACAAFLGDPLPSDPAAQAGRGPALLSARRRRAAAPDQAAALRRRLHDQGRAEAVQGAGRAGPDERLIRRQAGSGRGGLKRVRSFDGAGSAPQPTRRRVGSAARPRRRQSRGWLIAAGDLLSRISRRLRDSLEHIRQAEQILMQARSPRRLNVTAPAMIASGGGAAYKDARRSVAQPG